MMLSALFWAVMVCAAWMLIAPQWWELLLLAIVGSAVSYGWWLRRRLGKPRLLFAAACGLLALGSLWVAGSALFRTVIVHVDSVGPRHVVCGSAANPVPAAQLTLEGGTTVGGGSAASEVSHATLERVCDDWLRGRTLDAAGRGIVFALFAVRAAGHLLPRKMPV